MVAMVNLGRCELLVEGAWLLVLVLVCRVFDFFLVLSDFVLRFACIFGNLVLSFDFCFYVDFNVVDFDFDFDSFRQQVGRTISPAADRSILSVLLRVSFKRLLSHPHLQDPLGLIFHGSRLNVLWRLVPTQFDTVRPGCSCACFRSTSTAVELLEDLHGT